jgi:adenylylsulfate kinase-like enzyme
MKILIMGLPGCGKTTLAKAIVKRLQAVHFNADEVRQNINDDLGFSNEDRLRQSFRMGWLCDKVNEAGHNTVADFVCPTEKTRESFGERDLMVWMNNLDESRFRDTNRLFEPPKDADIVIDYFQIGDGVPVDETTLTRAVEEILGFLV